MRTTLLFITLIILLPLTSAVQDLLPPLPPMQERIILLPVIFCFGVMALPLIPSLFFALATALVQGLVLLEIQSGQAELGLTAPVVFFLGWAFLLQVLCESTGRMRWEFHALASCLVTLSLLSGEFLILCLKRGGFPLDDMVLFRLTVPSAAALLIAPLFYLLLGMFVPAASERMVRQPRIPGTGKAGFDFRGGVE